MKLSAEQEEELRELLDHHEQYSECQHTDECCVGDLIAFLEELLSK